MLGDIYSKLLKFERLSKRMSVRQRADALIPIVAELVGKFNKIHPFVNGNGRMGRLLLKWALARYGFKTRLKSATRPSPSDEYERAMEEASRKKYGRLIALIRMSLVL
jgi:fido (protein-threonine AMPylation protein)